MAGLGLGLGLGLNACGGKLSTAQFVSHMLNVAPSVTSLIVGDQLVVADGVVTGWTAGYGATPTIVGTFSTEQRNGRLGIYSPDAANRYVANASVVARSYWAVADPLAIPATNPQFSVLVDNGGGNPLWLYSVYSMSKWFYEVNAYTRYKNGVLFPTGTDLPDALAIYTAEHSTQRTGATFGGLNYAAACWQGWAGFFMTQDAENTAAQRAAIVSLVKRYYRIV